ncbi:MAG: 3-hydroxyacyl-CoA dehydrogenase family protein [Deltaproteobacteria bacterium]|nr:3-hydroxyacyl-CoA dehydrogenase family protein [Deltaproteobacteria bacterium]
MKLEDIKKVTFLDAGQIGYQAAQLFAHVGGYTVVFWDTDNGKIEEGLKAISDGLQRFQVDRGKMTQDAKNEIMGRISGTTDLAEAVRDADFVSECCSEDLELKKDLFKKLDEYAPADAILASNPICLDIAAIAAATTKPERVIGFHFFEPTAVMKLIEIIAGPNTSTEVLDTAVALAEKLGKEPVICRGFSYGHIANRAYFGMVKTAIEMVWERVASPADIDKSLKLGYNLPMGPLAVGDYAGFWGIFAKAEKDAMREAGPAAGHLHPLLRSMIAAGYPGGIEEKGIYAFYDEVLNK